MEYTHATCVMAQPHGSVQHGKEMKTLCNKTVIFDASIYERCPECTELFNKFPCNVCGLSREEHPSF